MRFLINIKSDSELITYEAIALGFTLASFDHEVQFYFADKSNVILADEESRLYGMVQSLELYDLPKAWTTFDVNQFDDAIKDMLTQTESAQVDFSLFDSILEF
ncbi:hypothetical protein [Moraxella ovis]|uniref:hypothetical protein n=1 Tax=Moraxella ovis TaxID=29433 RepID=UPI000D9575D1|nr:hypothetical protein [Moraxella ovis]SPX85143.1 Uncharacterised protein [Moraxella ovis]STZ05159.1 Uncharacterised protein [Moraxella ovis]